VAIRSIPWWVWLIPIVVVALATARLPYGYYTFTRLVVCGAAILFAFTSWNERPMGQAFAVVLVLLALLFNPIKPVYLKRETWFYLDWLAAGIFALNLIVVRLRLVEQR
jgi:hypothetical protein